MKGSSKVIVGATLIMVVCLALVLGLVFVLLAELYCSLFFSRLKLRRPSTSSTPSTTITSLPEPASATYQEQQQNSVPPSHSLSNFYAHGVLHAPRNFLFPSAHVVNTNYHHHRQQQQDLEKQLQQQQHSLRFLFGESQTQQPPSSSSSSSFSSQEFIVRAFSLPHSPTTFTPLASPPVHSGGGDYHEIITTLGGENNNNNYIYICNPIYDNNNNMPIIGLGVDNDDTPFETPDSSPSRLETMGSSGDDEDDHDEASTPSVLITPTEKLPPAPTKLGSSVCLKTCGSIAGTSVISDSNNSNIYGISSSSSSSSRSLCTFPSW